MTGMPAADPGWRVMARTLAYLYSVNSWMFWNSDPTRIYKWQGPYFSYDTAGSLATP